MIDKGNAMSYCPIEDKFMKDVKVLKKIVYIL